jgi:DUF4097 and DUF4098 domain-containing protein YvlB
MLALVALLLAAPLDRSWSFEAGAAPKVEVLNVNGVIAVKAEGSKIELRALSSDAGSWTVEAQEKNGKVKVSVECPHKGRRGCEGYVDFELTVPAGTRLAATNVSGEIRVRGVEGALAVETVSGIAEIDGSKGEVQLKTVSGRVRLAPAAVQATSISTVSGNAELELPRGAGATVTLASMSGRIEGAGQGGSHRRVVGDGSAPVSVSTISGSVVLSEH